MVEKCGGIAAVQHMLSNWHSGSGSFTTNAYDFFRYKADPVQWASVVWE
jgi:hypothetical protein